MQHGAENVQVVQERMVVSEEPPGETPDHPLDAPQYELIRRKLDDWWYHARQAHADNRRLQEEDEEFRDHEQWLPEDRSEVEGRGQKPTQFNVILPVIEWITGTEKRTRIDGVVYPRDETEEESRSGQAKTKLLKYLSDVNREPYERSDAFRDAATVGVGWLETGACSDPDEEPLYVRAESWRNVWWDPLCRHRDIGKYGRFLMRTRMLDADYAMAMFPERANQIYNAAEHVEGFDPEIDADGISLASGTHFHFAFAPEGTRLRGRVRVGELWHRRLEKCQVMRGQGALAGKLYRQGDPAHQWAQECGYVSLHDALRERVYVAVCLLDAEARILCLLHYSKSPYDHERFPLIPVWGYRRGKDGMPFGLVRGLKDIQQDLNKRRSKALHILSTNQVFFEDGAFFNEAEAQDEIDRPDGWLKLKAGGLQRVEVKREHALAQQHLELMEQDKRYVQEASGVTSENLGRETNATSGKAILARQNQGVTATVGLFDNLRYAQQLLGETKLALIEQFYTDEKIIRVTGGRQPEYVRINGEGSMLAAHAQDYIVDEQDFHASVRQAMADQLLAVAGNLAQAMPQVAVAFIDLAVELMDLPNKEAIVNRLRQITGMSDPDQEEDPEALAAQQAQAQKEAEFTERAQMAELAGKESKAALDQARAMREQMETLLRQNEALEKTVLSRLTNFEHALNVSGKLAVAPGLAAAADGLLDEVSQP